MSKIKVALIIVAVFIIWFFAAGFITVESYPVAVIISSQSITSQSNLSSSILDFGNIPKGANVSRSIDFENSTKNKILIKTLSLGEITDLIKINKAKSILSPGDQTEIRLNLSVPFSAEIKKYTGKIYIFKIITF